MDVVVRRRFVDEHYAGPPEVEHALDLLNRALEDLAHVHRGVDQGRQLPDNREASRRRAGAARLHRSAVFARGEVELPDGRGGGGPLLGQRHPALAASAFSRRHTSYPSISGIMTSTRITSSVVALRASSMPAAPDPAVTTSQPAVNSSVRRTSRSRSGSSSMISARKGSAIGPGCARGCRQY